MIASRASAVGSLTVRLHPPPALRLQANMTTPGIYMYAGDPNPGPQVYTTRALTL